MKIFNSPHFVLPFAVLSSFLFMWSKNWHMYPYASLAISCGAVTCFALVIFGLGKLCTHLWGKRISMGRSRLKWLGLLIFSLLVVLSIVIPLNKPLAILVKDGYLQIAFIVCATLLVFGICVTAQYAVLNIFLAVFILISIGNSAIGAVTYRFSDEPTTSSFSIALNRKPNIYLFWLESYHDLKTQEKEYGIDTTKIQNYLLRNDFSIYDNVYSNNWATLGSMTDVFTITNNVFTTYGNFDAPLNVREIIGGNAKNIVLRELKRNGYYTVFLTSNNTKFPHGEPYYHLGKRGIFLDDTDYLFNYSFSVVMQPITDLFEQRKVVADKEEAEVPTVDNTKFHGPLRNRVAIAMEEASKRGKSLFVSFKGGSIHTPPDGTYSWKNRDEWVKSGAYQRATEIGNEEIMDIVSMILEKDRKSIIILLGDHGSWRLRNIWEGIKVEKGDLRELEEFLKKNDEDLQALADDLYQVFMAIRTPEGAKDISFGKVISHVNLFRHVFAYLNNDPTILEGRAPSTTKFINHSTLIKDGKVL